jgi:electron transport protein HydN
MNRFIDVSTTRCIGCRTCEIACVLAHARNCKGLSAGAPIGDDEENDVLAYLGFLPRLTVIKNDNVCMPVTCHHCDDAPCASVCPTGAIAHRQDSVQVDHDRCVGCKSCVLICPYGMIDVITVPVSRPYAGVRLSSGAKAQAHKCDLCIDRSKGPACVAACPTKALRMVLQADVKASIRQRREQAVQETLNREATL